MQFRVIQGGGGALALYSDPLNRSVPPLILDSSQETMVPLFPGFVGQLCGVTVSEIPPYYPEHVSRGPISHLIEVVRRPQRAQVLVGRLASDWTSVPIVDLGFQWLGGQRRVELSRVVLDQLLHRVIEESGVCMSVTLSLGTEQVLGVLDEIVRNDESERDVEEIVAAILKLDVSPSALSHCAPLISTLIPHVIATAKRRLTELGDAQREMAAAQAAARQLYEKNCATIIGQRMMKEALGCLYEQWQRRHGLSE